MSAPAQKATDPLFARFQNPPQEARPRVWWHWMNGNVSQEGAELDLAWMKRIGIGGVHTFSGALLEPTVVSPPVPFMSDEWKKVFRSDDSGSAEVWHGGNDCRVSRLERNRWDLGSTGRCDEEVRVERDER